MSVVLLSNRRQEWILVVLSPYPQSAHEYSCFCWEHPHPCRGLCIELLLLTFLVTDELVNYIQISVLAWQRTLSLSIIKTSMLMLFIEIISIHCGIIENNCTGRSCCMWGICSRKLLHKLNTKFPFNTVYFLEVRGLTASFCIVYVYTTSGHMNLKSI